MTLDQLDQLIRKYLAMGVTVVIVLTGGPNTGTSNPSNSSTSSSSSATTSGAPPSVVTIDPNAPSGTDGSGGNPSDSTGAGGTDPNSADKNTAGRNSADKSTGTPSTGTPSTGTDRSSDAKQTGDNGGSGASGAGSAATKHNWGTPTRTEDFTNGTGGWRLYDGAGHGGKGRRSPGAATTANGILTITGSPDGTTEGMAWHPGQKYGRWEARVKSPAGDGDYHPVLLLWPDAENWPTGGEVDFMEISDAARQNTDFFLHYGADNQQKHGNVKIDATQWHDWAVEWTPQGITGYVDGNEWWKTTDTSVLPPGPMHMTIQLDWFPGGGTSKESSVQVDWVRQYAVQGG
jgi:Glycosyl hydrolases family 16